MLEMLKKIGLPATVAAVISALVTVVPFLFKIDERYAKAEELETEIAKTSRQINDLTVEVGRLAGAQQTMLALMAQAEQPRRAFGAAPPPAVIATPPPPVAVPMPMPVPAPAPALPPAVKSERAIKFDEVSRELQRSQQQIEKIQKY